MMISKTTLRGLIGAMALLACTASFAQAAAGSGSGEGRWQDRPAPSDAQRAEFFAKMKEHMAKRQAEIHDKLKLSSAQESTWKAFIDAVTPTNLRTPPDRKALEDLNAPARLEKMLERMKEHQTKLQANLSALKSLYAVLNPEQQKIMDESLHQLMRERMHGRRGLGFSLATGAAG
jgi:periplasmic protein CpxP/Spy